LTLVDNLCFVDLVEYRKIIINNIHIPPKKKKVGESLKISIVNTFLAIGIKPVKTKTNPERFAISDFVMNQLLISSVDSDFVNGFEFSSCFTSLN